MVIGNMARCTQEKERGGIEKKGAEGTEIHIVNVQFIIPKV